MTFFLLIVPKIVEVIVVEIILYFRNKESATIDKDVKELKSAIKKKDIESINDLINRTRIRGVRKQKK